VTIGWGRPAGLLIVTVTGYSLNMAPREQGMDATSTLSEIRPYLRKLKRHRRHVSKLINYGTSKKLANILMANGNCVGKRLFSDVSHIIT